jgi:hypothetical protein
MQGTLTPIYSRNSYNGGTTDGRTYMGLLDDLQNKASELFGGASDIASDAGADLSGLSTDVQEQVTQYAQEHNVSIEAAKEHILGGGN